MIGIKKLQIGDTIYEANTDFRIAIECNKIATDDKIGDFERVLGVICTIFGNDGIDKCKEHPEHIEKLLKWSKNWLSCGKEIEETKEQPDMDYEEDKHLIRSSFIYDYKYNPYDMEYLSWEDFYNDLNNLSNSELGNCCVLNRIRNLRNYDLSQIKDNKERQKIAKAKEYYALKKYKVENHLTKEQEESMERLNKILGL